MGAGIEHPLLGYAAFCAVKLAGYSTGGWILARVYGEPRRNPLVVGAARTAIGMGVGAAWWACIGLVGAILTSLDSDARELLPILGIVGLVPIRLGEWWLLVWWLFDRPLARRALGWRVALLGTVGSFVLDAPAVAGFLQTSGFYVC